MEMIEELCGIPAVGVVPYMDVDIEDEDSLSSRLDTGRGPQAEKKAVDIAVIRFPRLSNFTDLQVFERIGSAGVRYVDRAASLGTPDLIVLPGTKNTMEDLLWMRQSGLEALVLKAAARGVPVWGICGGYQMMGRELWDEEGWEGGEPGKRTAGLGLLPIVTRFCEEKTRTRVRGTFGAVEGIFSGLSGLEAEGYEIHMGQSTGNDGGLLRLREYQQDAGIEKWDGCCSENIFGTYVHGIFDAPGIAETVVNALLRKKGLPALEEAAAFNFEAYRESQYDRLAEILRQHLDMKEIYRILEAGV